MCKIFSKVLYKVLLQCCVEIAQKKPEPQSQIQVKSSHVMVFFCVGAHHLHFTLVRSFLRFFLNFSPVFSYMFVGVVWGLWFGEQSRVSSRKCWMKKRTFPLLWL
jgi:hypothetical protein